jgi:hypothetical protein
MLPASATCEALKKTGSSLGYAPIASMPGALIPTEVRYFTYAGDQRMTRPSRNTRGCLSSNVPDMSRISPEIPLRKMRIERGSVI